MNATTATTDEPAGNTALGIARRYFGTQHPLFRVMGVDIVGVDKGRAECSMPCTPAMQDHRGALPECATMTFDYLRPAFAKTLVAVAHTVRAGKRITTVSVQLRQEGQLVCIGRFLFPLTR